MNLFLLAGSAWSVAIFTLSSGLFVFYVLEVIRRGFFRSRDGQEPTPATQASLKNDPSHREPKDPGPLGYSGKVKIVFA